MIRFVITSHAHLDGVRLSRLGSWGNVPHASEDSARLAASINANGHPFRISREHHRALPAFQQGERGAA